MLSFDTLCIHAGHEPDQHHAHLTPLYATSTFSFESAEHAAAIFQGQVDGYVYGRFGNPTVKEAERKLAALEAYDLIDSADEPVKLQALLHSSGMAALTTLMLGTLKSGDKIITHRSLYGGTQELLDKVLQPLGIGYVLADFDYPDEVQAAIASDPAIRMMYIETPANPTLLCIDLEVLCAIGKQANLFVCADNTFATPYLQQPFRYGVDFVMHSTTKYLNGHGTAVGGVLIGRADETDRWQRLTKVHRLLGGNSNAFDAFFLLSGIRTLPLRMERHCTNAETLAMFLSAHGAVDHVNYPGLITHPQHELAARQMNRFGGMLSFELKGGLQAGKKFINALRLCTHAVSLGTCDTLVSHPASTTHAGVPREARLAGGITDGLIRMSAGLEGPDDLLADVKQALDAVRH